MVNDIVSLKDPTESSVRDLIISFGKKYKCTPNKKDLLNVYRQLCQEKNLSYDTKYEKILIQNISDFVTDNGKLFVVTEVINGTRKFENGPPWLLNYEYMESFENLGLKQIVHSTDHKAERGEECHLSIFQGI